MTRILTEHDVASVVTLDDCIEAVESVFRAYGEGRLAPSHSLGMQAGEGTIHIKAAAAGVFVAKLNANFPANPARHGLPTIQGLIVVVDLERGSLLAILDSTLITTLRTAAATAVAAKYLARSDAKVAAIIGCGNQGRASLQALMRVRALERVVVYDSDRQAARRLAGETSSSVADSIDDAVSRADIVVTSTTSRQPLLHLRHARPGLFIAAVGADNPHKIEIAPELMARCRVVADVVEQAATMGDLHHAIAAGLMAREDVHGDLAAVICGKVSGRRSADELFVFDSTGTALQDVVVAELALQRAAAADIGSNVAFTSGGSPPIPRSERAAARPQSR